MNTKTYLHIANKCGENWENMTQEQKGRFCESCEKVVIDFTTMTDQELIAFLKTSNGKLCGRVHQDQLNRALRATNIDNKKGWKLFVAGFASLFFAMQKSMAQNKQMKDVINSELKQKNLLQNMASNNNAEQTLKGIIVNENKLGLLNATITDADNLNKVFTNKNGNFVMQLSANVDAVLVSAKGYESRVVPVSFFNNADTTIVLGKEDTSGVDINNIDAKTFDKNIVMGGITAFTEKDTVQTTVTTFVKKIFNNAFFKIHPNPTTKNGVGLSIKQVGTYTVQIFDNNSKLIHQQTVVVNSKGQIVQISFPNCVVKGTYYVRVIDGKTKKEYVDKIINGFIF